MTAISSSTATKNTRILSIVDLPELNPGCSNLWCQGRWSQIRLRKDVNENLARYTEKSDATVISTVSRNPIPYSEMDGYAPKQVQGNGNRLLEGSQG